MLFPKHVEDKASALLAAIEGVEDFFYYEKKGELYDFLLRIIEKPLIENVLSKTGGNQIRAADILGINRNTLHSKIRKLNIDVEKFKNG